MSASFAIAQALHVLAAVVWVGGMFFAHMAVRPAAQALLDPPQRLSLWASTFARFFRWVWLSIGLLFLTGYWVIFLGYGGMAQIGSHVHAMHGIGVVMLLLYTYVYVVPYRHMRDAVSARDWQQAARRLQQIRTIVVTNLILGLTTVVVASGGRYWQ